MGIQLKQLADASAGLEGTDLNNGSFIFISIPYNTTSPLTLSAITLPRRCIVQSVTVVPDVASTNAVTAQVFKAPSGTALGSGTAVSATMVLNGTAATTVTGAIVAGTADCANGQRLGVVISGALGASGSGVVTIALNPA